MPEATFLAALAVVFFAGYALGRESSGEPLDSVQALLEARREAVREDYAEGRISHERFADEIELLEDPATEEVMHAVTDVSGIGPKTALEIARSYRSVDELAAATASSLEAVNGVGENRAGAICARSFE